MVTTPNGCVYPILGPQQCHAISKVPYGIGPISNRIPATRGNVSIDNHQGYIFPFFPCIISYCNLQWMSSISSLFLLLGLFMAPQVFIKYFPSPCAAALSGKSYYNASEQPYLEGSLLPSPSGECVRWYRHFGAADGFTAYRSLCGSNTLHGIPGPSLGLGPSPDIFS